MSVGQRLFWIAAIAIGAAFSAGMYLAGLESLAGCSAARPSTGTSNQSDSHSGAIAPGKEQSCANK